MNSSAENIDCFCNVCQIETPHARRACEAGKYKEGTEECPRMLNEEWTLFHCIVCGKLKAVVVENATDGSEPNRIHYPAIRNRQIPRWTPQLPADMQIVIREVYIALDGNCPCLAAMGARAIVDQMLNLLVGDRGGFDKKLSEAVKQQKLTAAHRDVIAAAVEVGHAASHRAFVPSIGQIADMLLIVEYYLMGEFILGPISKRLAAAAPPRPKGGT